MKAARRLQRGRAPAEGADLLARLYANRGVLDPAELDCSLSRMVPVGALGGIDRATALLEQALTRDRRILVVGDFDADGATSTALALRALRAMGAAAVDYLVPNRFEYGYGLTPEIVAVAADRAPDLIITVDNGISSLDGVAAARGRGMQVLVTDHHLPGARLPDAEAIVNPNLADDPFPSKALAGVGVIFYVMAALRARLRDRGWFGLRGIPEPNLGSLLDLVALGTVADVVPLDRNNRILVEQGLRRMRAGQAAPGIRALLQVAGRHPERVVAADLGFAVGPRLNAAGRMDDMAIGIECLLADDPDRALTLAQTLDDLNRDRREVEAQMQDQALDSLTRLMDERGLTGAGGHGLCLYEPEWHQGVIGIVASRIKDRVHRPVIAFADAGNGQLKGSARSIPGLHIRDTLDAIASTHPGLVSKFGGHAMAAGLSLSADRFEAFRQVFDETVRRFVDPADLEGVICSDGPLAPHELTLETAEALRAGGPWGQGFPEPLFDGEFEVLERRWLKGRHVRLRLRHPEGGEVVTGIAFNADPAQWPEGRDRVHLAYRLDSNEYRGLCSVQMVVEHVF
ncbi:single-stranded-DNA-specific exonuclease RecJ [Ectothiorhodospira lacustris]|uniref:single-stranded-DNA-specific exonuclease RecJ n=1 Tax=Ectothiorhodospira lacustris TaxID=2899127 RepID=UPI001EE86984|nr:single-stranded-DNA-specific exonuclease RecJ [Ectothiorhodospira lacustris]MCG5500244.1 single-stranded-DNA-specific exonuclease RecJ [Ectothiorhodospira lacustris]MCG5510292.1 single-stranded-DNA-specific exonuclease RecJ [Ectothiorhodospira lacustris]MCG5521841.1 single-stranded-DNA-specific exonuclease RecJ [Ectothiorhodospira lacustris]